MVFDRVSHAHTYNPTCMCLTEREVKVLAVIIRLVMLVVAGVNGCMGGRLKSSSKHVQGMP